jgi:hypothetical protein
MSEQEWSKEAIFETPVLQQELRERMKLQRPAGIDTRIVSPPAQAPVQEELRQIFDDPLLAAQLWQQVQDVAPDEPAPRAPDDELAVQMGLAVYILHGLHAKDRGVHEHLPRPGRSRARDDDEPRPLPG